jgi:hypothetical protein
VEVVDLWERSPYRLTDDGPNADGIVDLLFPGDPLLCQKVVEVLGGSIDAALDAGNFVVTLRLAARIQQRPPSITQEHRERVSGLG